MIRKISVSFSLLVLLLVGCQPPQEKNAPIDGRKTGGKLRIAVIPKGTTHEFWKSVHYGADQAASEFDAQVLWLGPLLENQTEEQIRVVENFITQQVDGICLAPLESQALIAPVKQAWEAGIPVVVFDSGLDDESITVSYVATDNFHGGELAAEEMARRMNGKGDVILLRYAAGSESTEQRERGFLSKVAEFPEMRVVSSNEYCGTSPELALDKAQQVFNKFRGKFDGVFATCEPNCTGVLGALEDAELAGEVVFIGFDPSPRLVKTMADGKMQGIVLQDPVKMGYLAVKTMVQHLREEPVETRISTGEYIATPENMNDELMDKLLHPAQFDE